MKGLTGLDAVDLAGGLVLMFVASIITVSVVLPNIYFRYLKVLKSLSFKTFSVCFSYQLLWLEAFGLSIRFYLFQIDALGRFTDR